MSRYGDRFTEHPDAAAERRALSKYLRGRDDWADVRRFANGVAGQRVIDALNVVQAELAEARRSMDEDPGGSCHGNKVYLAAPEQVLEDMRDRVIDLLAEENPEAHETRAVQA